ncbi:IclR family transcriptional regulator [Subtercola sp. YIM 133946]|uniref:IclR family transcriptional regulator n=1 Tax=Subtercola sp. YIM 133946 TaxID=3118909 RepID=UPI002F9395B0
MDTFVIMWETSGDRPKDLIESIDNAMRVLLMLAVNPEVRVSAVAEALGVSASSAHRILATLTFRGFVAQDRITKAYRAGSALIELGVRSTSGLDLRGAAEPHLAGLAAEFGETVNLMVLEGAMCRFIAGVESTQRLRTQVLTGTLLPAYATSGGKVLLAELSQSELHDIYPHGLRKLTPHTKTFTQLVDELTLISHRGYATNIEESVPGLRAVAVPVRDRAGVTIGALAMSAPSVRLKGPRVRDMVVALRECAGRIRMDAPFTPIRVDRG